jgi:hypothetical protein
LEPIDSISACRPGIPGSARDLLSARLALHARARSPSLAWGEGILATLFAAKAFVRPSRLRVALAWAGHFTAARRSRWQLALSCCAHHGRFLARQALLGIRTPEDLRRLVILKGEAHLKATSTGAIILGFHLGPPGVPWRCGSWDIP